MTSILGVPASRELREGDSYPLDSGLQRVSPVSVWMLRDLTSFKDSYDPSDIGDWLEFFRIKLPEFSTLANLGYKGYILAELTDDNDYVDFPVEGMQLLSSLGLALSVVGRSRSQISGLDQRCWTTEFLIPEPHIYYSEIDEENFFRWLRAVKSVTDVIGTPAGIVLRMDNPCSATIVDLIAVMSRYELDMTCLSALREYDEHACLSNSEEYWYPRIFPSKPD